MAIDADFYRPGAKIEDTPENHDLIMMMYGSCIRYTDKEDGSTHLLVPLGALLRRSHFKAKEKLEEWPEVVE